MKNEINFQKWLDNDRVVKLISVLIAVISWLIIAITIAPDGKAVIENIPIDFELANTTPEANNLSIIEGADQTVSVKVEGKNYKLGNLTNDDFIAVPTLTKVTEAGEYKISVDVKKINDKDDEYKVISSSSTVTAKFDYIIEVTKPLNASAEKIMAIDGYLKDEPYVNPEKIVLKGPKAEIEKIEKCVVSSEEKKTTDETVTLDGELKFYDKNDIEISSLKHIEYETQNYEIIVPINKHKVVPLKINFVNVPQGIDVSKLKYTMSIDTLEIAGPKKIVDDCKEITLGEMDFRMIDVGTTKDFDIELRAGLTSMDNVSKVTVEIDKDNLTSKQFSIKNILTKNEPANHNIEVLTMAINNVKIVGDAFDMEKVAANDLIATIDFKDIEIADGTSRVPVTIYITGNKFAWAVGEYRVVINATKK